MKKALLFFASIFLLLIINSCSTLSSNSGSDETKPINVYVDEFKDTRTWILRQFLRPEEFKTGINWAELTYQRLFGPGKGRENSNIYFVISRSSNSFIMTNEAYAKINGEIYNLRIEREGTYDKASFNKPSDNDNINVYKNIEEKFYIELSPEMINSIKKADDIIFRFYFGPEQATYIVKENKLNEVKELFK